MRLSFKIDKEDLKNLMVMPESSMIMDIRVNDEGMVEFLVQDIAVPEAPGILEVRPMIIEDEWSWNLGNH